MRSPADPEKIRRLMRELGRRVRGPGRIYLVGGASALLLGWRATTVDVDLEITQEPANLFQSIAQLKDELDVNVELSAPHRFVPALSDWEQRSVFIAREGEVDASASFIARMSIFKPYDPDQSFLFPPSPRDWLPQDHLVWFVSDTVDELDLSELMKSYRSGGKGEKAYHPSSWPSGPCAQPFPSIFYPRPYPLSFFC